MELTDEVIGKISLGKTLTDNEGSINSLDFHAEANLLITSSDDETINIYATQSGRRIKTLPSHKYGVDKARFLRDPNKVVCASKNGWDEALRQWDIESYKFLCYYKGHRAPIVSLDVDTENSILSASEDGEVRLWTAGNPVCQGLLRMTGKPVVGFDPKGLIFVVINQLGDIRLYDKNSFDKGPFETFHINGAGAVSHLLISPDGTLIAVSAENAVYLVDSFKGTVVSQFSEHVTKGDTSFCSNITFSPDSKYLVTGSRSGDIFCYNVTTSELVSKFHMHSEPVSQVKWHPTSILLASATQDLGLWTCTM